MLIKKKKKKAPWLVAINKNTEWGHHIDFPKIKNKEDPDKASENYRVFKMYPDATLRMYFPTHL